MPYCIVAGGSTEVMQSGTDARPALSRSGPLRGPGVVPPGGISRRAFRYYGLVTSAAPDALVSAAAWLSFPRNSSSGTP